MQHITPYVSARQVFIIVVRTHPTPIYTIYIWAIGRIIIIIHYIINDIVLENIGKQFFFSN